MTTVIEKLRELHAAAMESGDVSDFIERNEHAGKYAPAFLALADAVKEALDGSWKIQVHAARDIQAFERDDVENVRKALADLEKEAQ